MAVTVAALGHGESALLARRGRPLAPRRSAVVDDAPADHGQDDLGVADLGGRRARRALGQISED